MAVPPPSPTPSHPLALGRAATLWVLYALVFNIAGGIAAGVIALVFFLITGGLSDELYAVIYAICGFIAYRLARTVGEGR